MSRMLAQVQKQHIIDCSQEFIYFCEYNPDEIVQRIVTMDEIEVHYFEPECKEELIQWHKKGKQPSKKFQVLQSTGKIM